MHGIQALEQISEKINTEYMSQDEEDEEEEKQVGENSVSDITQFSVVSQKKGSEQEDIDRITDELRKMFCPENGDVTQCLVDIKGHKSIFSQDFLDEEEKNSTN